MTFEDLQSRIEVILPKLDAEIYRETIEVFEMILDDMWCESFTDFCSDIIDKDKNYLIHPDVSSLLLEILTEEMNNGNSSATCLIGSLYYTGRIGEQNYEKGVYYYEKSAKMGDRQAQENLGYCYYYGRLGEVDYKRAYHYFVKGALDGHVNSLYKIGDMYLNGYYVEKDEVEAFNIYRHCFTLLEDNADLFGADVYIRLADCYFYGTGTEINYQNALSFYQLAEKYYYPRISDGDFMYTKQYYRSIEMQNKVREELGKNIPSYDWRNKTTN